MKILAVAMCLIFMLSVDSHARGRGLVLVGMGEDIFHAADLPSEDYDNYELGLYYESFSLFFIPVFTWNKRYVLFSGDAYVEFDQGEELKIKEALGESSLGGSYFFRRKNRVI